MPVLYHWWVGLLLSPEHMRCPPPPVPQLCLSGRRAVLWVPSCRLSHRVSLWCIKVGGFRAPWLLRAGQRPRLTLAVTARNWSVHRGLKRQVDTCHWGCRASALLPSLKPNPVRQDCHVRVHADVSRRKVSTLSEIVTAEILRHGNWGPPSGVACVPRDLVISPPHLVPGRLYCIRNASSGCYLVAEDTHLRLPAVGTQPVAFKMMSSQC